MRAQQTFAIVIVTLGGMMLTANLKFHAFHDAVHVANDDQNNARPLSRKFGSDREHHVFSLERARRSEITSAAAWLDHLAGAHQASGAATSEGHPGRQQTLQCAPYAGPMYFRYFPKPEDVPQKAVAGLELPELHRLRPVEPSLRPFQLQEVRLLEGSRFHTAFATNSAFLHLLDPDRLLYYFRQLARLPQVAGAQPYGGWESLGSGLRGEFVGHFLSAAAAASAAGGDEVLRARCAYLTEVLFECQVALKEGGYVSAFPSSQLTQSEELCQGKGGCGGPWVPYYVMHKLLNGLLAHHHATKSETALRVAVGLADYLAQRVKNLLAKYSSRHWYQFINLEVQVGGMSEALAELAVITANHTWLEMAAMFERPCFVSPLLLAGTRMDERSHTMETENTQDLCDRGSENDRDTCDALADAVQMQHSNTHLPQRKGHRGFGLERAVHRTVRASEERLK
eukprot:gene14905-17621_t